MTALPAILCIWQIKCTTHAHAHAHLSFFLYYKVTRTEFPQPSRCRLTFLPLTKKQRVSERFSTAIFSRSELKINSFPVLPRPYITTGRDAPNESYGREEAGLWLSSVYWRERDGEISRWGEYPPYKTTPISISSYNDMVLCQILLQYLLYSY